MAVTPEDIRTMVIGYIDADLNAQEEQGVEDPFISVADDSFAQVCSEGCAGVAPVGGAPGFVITTERRQRFHVTIREVTNAG